MQISPIEPNIQPIPEGQFLPKPKRTWEDFSFRRDLWFPVYYFFWNRTWWIRRIYCKHNGVHMSDSSRWGSLTVCANCYSPNVPQCGGMRQPETNWTGLAAYDNAKHQ